MVYLPLRHDDIAGDVVGGGVEKKSLSGQCQRPPKENSNYQQDSGARERYGMVRPRCCAALPCVVTGQPTDRDPGSDELR